MRKGCCPRIARNVWFVLCGWMWPSSCSPSSSQVWLPSCGLRAAPELRPEQLPGSHFSGFYHLRVIRVSNKSHSRASSAEMWVLISSPRLTTNKGFPVQSWVLQQKEKSYLQENNIVSLSAPSPAHTKHGLSLALGQAGAAFHFLSACSCTPHPSPNPGCDPHHPASR